LLYPADREATGPLTPPAVATAAAFALEYALAQTWQAWGIMPESVLGVGSGEITAAVLAGVVSLADGARLAAAGELLALQAGQVQAQTGELSIFSAQAGNWMGAQDYTAHYWSQLQPAGDTTSLAVAFERIQHPSRLLLILGQLPAGLPSERLPAPPLPTLPPAEALTPAGMQRTLGELWLAGVAVDWQAIHGDEERRRVVLPTYPFERKRYWIEARSLNDSYQPAGPLHKNPDLGQWGYLPG